MLTGLAAGDYTISISDENLCSVEMEATVNLNGECDYSEMFYIPNIFSPNEDNLNDVLYVRGSGIVEMEFVIFDRWGEKVFESASQDRGWDGTYKDKPLNQAVFVYQITIEFVDGTRLNDYGNVTLVR